jgi:hypothetical protein
MTQVNIYGPYFGQDGYSSHVLGLSNALNKLEGIEVALGTQRPVDWVRHVNDDELQMLNRDLMKGDINLMIGIPTFWPLLMCEDKSFIGFCVWEGDRVPESWIEIFLDNRLNQIWVPSNHTKEAIWHTIQNYEKINDDKHTYKKILDKIKIVPHGVDVDLFKPLNIKHSKFTFVMNGGWVHGWKDRKGLSYGIKAFCEEFNKDENVRMIVKINSCYGGDLQKNINELKIENKTPAELQIVPQQIPFKDLVKVYNEGDIFVNTSLADGFNLNCLEAQACGLPVLTTSFGGQSDFCNNDNGWLLEEGTMKENKWDLQYEGTSWKEPSIEEIRKKMRDCYNNQIEVTTKGMTSRMDSKDWTWDCSARKALEAIELTVL